MLTSMKYSTNLFKPDSTRIDPFDIAQDQSRKLIEGLTSVLAVDILEC
jgi:hypothetical protein